jgi:hypothetical protein
MPGKPRILDIFHYRHDIVPDIPGIETDYGAAVFREINGKEELLARLDGKTYAWRPFFEPFGGDRYLLGTEYDEQVLAGAYTVVVTSPDNTGKYVLAVGMIEKFPTKEMAQTVVALPKLKRYFGKSSWTAFFNLLGVPGCSAWLERKNRPVKNACDFF